METTAIWNQFSASIKRFILSHVNDVEVTNDLLQEVFIKVHLKSSTVKNQESIKSWVFTITNNVINDYFKKNVKSEIFSSEITATEESTNNEHCAKDCLLPLINNLPSTYKEAILLSEIKGLKQAEIAKKLNISLSGAKSRIQRGRNLLKQGYMHCCDYKLNESGYLIGEHKDKKDCKICS